MQCVFVPLGPVQEYRNHLFFLVLQRLVLQDTPGCIPCIYYLRHDGIVLRWLRCTEELRGCLSSKLGIVVPCISPLLDYKASCSPPQLTVPTLITIQPIYTEYCTKKSDVLRPATLYRIPICRQKTKLGALPRLGKYMWNPISPISLGIAIIGTSCLHGYGTDFARDR